VELVVTVEIIKGAFGSFLVFLAFSLGLSALLALGPCSRLEKNLEIVVLSCVLSVDFDDLACARVRRVGRLKAILRSSSS